ncbi:ferrous iron transport protein A [Thermosynechococcaceae cyanobacterium Okahandja]
MSSSRWRPFIYIADPHRQQSQRQEAMSKPLSLATATVGDRYRIAELRCTNSHQLLAMGLAPNAVMTVLQRHDQGAVMVGVDTQRFCLNHELAAKIMLTPLEAITLGTAPVGSRLRVVGYAATAPIYKRKLLAMGLTPGVEIEVIRHAPLGDPTDIRVRGFHLSLRRDEAAALQVQQI